MECWQTVAAGETSPHEVAAWVPFIPAACRLSVVPLHVRGAAVHFQQRSVQNVCVCIFSTFFRIHEGRQIAIYLKTLNKVLRLDCILFLLDNYSVNVSIWKLVILTTGLKVSRSHF
jgi:hypothetical protein